MFFNITPSISVHRLVKIQEKQPSIIDVREPNEYESGHIPGAKNVPLDKIGAYSPRGTQYIICRSGRRSKKATKILINHGYSAFNVRGGMVHWRGTIIRGE